MASFIPSRLRSLTMPHCAERPIQSSSITAWQYECEMNSFDSSAIAMSRMDFSTGFGGFEPLRRLRSASQGK